MATFRTPQINLYRLDIARSLAFYTGLGFVETFRTPIAGPPDHVELILDGFTLGIATVNAAIADHGLQPQFSGRAIEIVLWTDDTDGAFAWLTVAGARPVVAARLAGRYPHRLDHRSRRQSDPACPAARLSCVATRFCGGRTAARAGAGGAGRDSAVAGATGGRMGGIIGATSLAPLVWRSAARRPSATIVARGDEGAMKNRYSIDDVSR